MVENENKDGEQIIKETTFEERNNFRIQQVEELSNKLDEIKIKINSETLVSKNGDNWTKAAFFSEFEFKKVYKIAQRGNSDKK